MKRLRTLLVIAGLLAVAWPLSLSAEPRFPQPDFDGSYAPPTVRDPSPRDRAFEWMDAAILTGLIAAASFFALRGRSRAGILCTSIVSLLVLVQHYGGVEAASNRVQVDWPQLFSRPGGQGRYTPGIWFSYILLWFLCDPMFPQLFQRFYTADSRRTLSKIMLLYPLVCTMVFFLPISVGIFGRISYPDLVGKGADRILPMVLTLASGESRTYGLQFVLSDQIRNIENVLLQNQRPVAVGIPGYIVPMDLQAKLFLNYPAAVGSLSVEPAGALTITEDSPTAGGWKAYTVQGSTWGRSRLTVTYADGAVQTIHYYVINIYIT